MWACCVILVVFAAFKIYEGYMNAKIARTERDMDKWFSQIITINREMETLIRDYHKHEEDSKCGSSSS